MEILATIGGIILTLISLILLFVCIIAIGSQLAMEKRLVDDFERRTGFRHIDSGSVYDFDKVRLRVSLGIIVSLALLGTGIWLIVR